MFLPWHNLFGWSFLIFFSLLVLPLVLNSLPVIFGFLTNFFFWLIWFFKYRQDK